MPEAARRFVQALTPARSTCWLWLQPEGVVELGRGVGGKPLPVAMPWAAWCAAHPGARCHLLVSSQLLSLLTVAPGLDLGTRDDIAEHARAQFVHYHGAAAQGWPLLPWQAGLACGATALSGVAIATLQASADAHGVQLLSLQPAWSALLASRAPEADAPPQSLLILDEGTLLTAVACSQGKPTQVMMRRCDAVGSDELLGEWIQELQLPAGVKPQRVQVPAGLQPLQGRPPAARQQFIQVPRHSPLAWVAALGSGLLAAVAVADAMAAWQQSQAALAAADPAPRLVQQAGLRAADGPTEAQAALLASLATPWPAAFAAAEASTVAGVRWLGLELDGRHLRLEGTASELAVAWQAAAALAQQPGVSESALARVQSDSGLVRFELRAAWSAGSAAEAQQAAAR